MAKIKLLEIGCTMQQVIDTINKLVAAYNDGQELAEYSYNDLKDIPTVNGIPLLGDLKTMMLNIRTAETVDWRSLLESIATKSYADRILTNAVAEAKRVAISELGNKLNKDLSNVESVEYVGDKAYIPMVIGSTIVKVPTRSLAAYANNYFKEDSYTLEASVKNQRRVMEIQEVEPGESTYATKTEFVLGSSSLYINNERLFRGVDYVEVDSSSITLLTHYPLKEGDVLVFEAVPKD